MALSSGKRQLTLSLTTFRCFEIAGSILQAPTFRKLYSTSKSGSKDPIGQSQQKASQNSRSSNSSESSTPGTKSDEKPQKTKTIKELDDELRMKMEGLAGDGGEAGVEYEDGEPTAMKRSVRNNMFRVI